MTYPTRTLRELSRVIFSRLLGIILIMVIVVAGVMAATFFGPWQYRSKVTLKAEPTSITLSPLDAPTGIRDRLSLFILTQREIINTEYVQASALMKLDNIKPLPGGPTDIEGQQWYTDVQVSEFAAGNFERLASVRKRIKVTTPGGVDVSQIFSITVDWPEERGLSTDGEIDSRTLATKRAQRFTQCLVDAYQFRRSSLEIKQATKDSMVLTKQATEAAKANLKKAQEELVNYIDKEIKGDIQEAKNISIGIGETGIQTQRTKNQNEISIIDTRLAELTALNEQIDVELKKGPNEQVVIPALLLTDNLALEKIIGKIADLRIKLNNLTPQFEDSYKDIKEAKAELDSNLSHLKDELARQRTMLNMDIAALRSQRTVLQKMVTDDEKKMAVLGPKAMVLDGLTKNVEAAQKMYSTRLDGYLNAERAEMAAKMPDRVSVISDPSLPDVSKPRRPIMWANILASIFASLVLALVYAFLADHFDHTVKGIDDVERYIETNVLTSVPKFSHKIIRTNRGI